MSCLLPFAAQSRMVIFHSLQMLKQTQAAAGEQRPDTDPSQSCSFSSPFPKPHCPSLRTPGAGSRTTGGSADPPLEGPTTSPSKQRLVLCLLSLNRVLLRTAPGAATRAEAAWGRQPQHPCQPEHSCAGPVGCAGPMLGPWGLCQAHGLHWARGAVPGLQATLGPWGCAGPVGYTGPMGLCHAAAPHTGCAAARSPAHTCHLPCRGYR